jgi:lycopene cyclase domain-containing protein
MKIYPVMAVSAAAVVIVLELRLFRTGLFRSVPYWLALLISFGFMIPVDGWLTKLSAPIVTYDDRDTSAIRPIWDILVEEYAYAFALITLVLAMWQWSGRRSAQGPS